MKLKKFLEGKVLGNPYYERITLIIVYSVILALFVKVVLGMLTTLYAIYDPTLFNSAVISIIVGTIVYILIDKSGVEQLKTWDRIEITVAVSIDMYKTLYYIEVFMFMLALGFKVLTLLVLSALIITISHNYIKGKKYDEQKHGLKDYQTDIKPK